MSRNERRAEIKSELTEAVADALVKRGKEAQAYAIANAVMRAIEDVMEAHEDANHGWKE